MWNSRDCNSENVFLTRNGCPRLSFIFAMIRIIIVLGLAQNGYPWNQNESGNHFRFNELNLKHDHCRYPKIFDRDKWGCVCPGTMTKVEDDCVCQDCMFNTVHAEYSEKLWDDLLQYGKEEMKEEVVPSKKDTKPNTNEHNSSSETEIGPRRLFSIPFRPKEGSIILKLPTVAGSKGYNNIRILKPKEEHKFLILKPHVQTSASSSGQGSSLKQVPLPYDEAMREPTQQQLPREQIFIHNGQEPVLPQKEPLPPQDEVSSPHKESSQPVHQQEVIPKAHEEVAPNTNPPQPAQPPTDAGTFSDSVLFGQTSGHISSGSNTAVGEMTAPKGTGSLALAADSDSSGASAFTGQGSSLMKIQSAGAEASGFSVLGARSRKASSTSLLLTGKGDAVATNTLTEDASSSAAAVATQQQASASAAAFGAAVASAAAAPGKEGSNSSASYDDGLVATANVTGKGVVVDTVAVGDASDTLRAALENRKSEASTESYPKTKMKEMFNPTGNTANANSNWLWN